MNVYELVRIEDGEEEVVARSYDKAVVMSKMNREMIEEIADPDVTYEIREVSQ